jgi:hypothetical protein
VSGTYALGLVGGGDELLAESLPVLVVGRLLDDDLFVVVRQLKDNVLELLGELQVIVASNTVRRGGCSRYRYISAGSRRIVSDVNADA